jgi:hypothetical protein
MNNTESACISFIEIIATKISHKAFKSGREKSPAVVCKPRPFFQVAQNSAVEVFE